MGRKRTGGKHLKHVTVSLLMVLGIALMTGCGEETAEPEDVVLEVVDSVVPEPMIEYGFNLDSFDVFEGMIQPNQFLADILLKYEVTYPEITRLVEKADSIFDIRKIKADRDYMVLCKKDSTGQAVCFIYEKSPTEYVVFDMRDSMDVYIGTKDIELVEREASGTIETSLWDAMVGNDLSPALVVNIADIFAWTIDFYTVQVGDNFKVIFDEKFVDGEYVGVGDIKCIMFQHREQDYYGFSYIQDSAVAFFDEQGMSMKKAFLKSPLEFSQITSGFTMNRVHPVTGVNKPHLGTDYAAPEGTPIMSVGDGVILEAQYKQYNGNYVKVKHNDIVTTQYLHMSKIAEGIVPGVAVKQGQTIGYVGSTGLATGPHVCFRYWKNGEQVDHRKEKFESSEPIKEEIRADYEAYMEEMKARLDAIPVN